MREYELMVIVAQEDVKEGFQDELIAQMRETVDSLGGRVLRVRPWGLRELAYEIKDNNRGYYVIMQLLIDTVKLPLIEEKLKINERVLRYIFVMLEDRGDEDVEVLMQKFAEEEADNLANKVKDDEYEKVDQNASIAEEEHKEEE